MPRKNPFPKDQAAVCKRLLEFRRLTGLTRVRFAERAGVDHHQLTSIEHARAPLRYSVGAALCRTHGINPIWLVTGEESAQGSFDDFVWGRGVAPRTLFTTVILLHRTAIVTARADARRTLESVIGAAEAAMKRKKGAARSGEAVALIDDLLWVHDRLSERARQFESLGKKTLAYVAPHDISEHVPTTLLDSLLTRAKRVTEGRGRKAELARALDVPPQRVTQWFSRASAPNAEDALRLQTWVIAAEAAQQKEDPDRVSARPGRMTRKSKNTTNEKAKSDRRKR